VDRLIERVRRNLNTLDPNRLSHDRWFHALLACGDPKAYKEYLRWLDAVPPIGNVGSDPERDWQLPETASLLPYKAGARKAPLLKAHAGDFLAHVLRRLESNSRLIRQGGQQVFVGALHWDFGFDYRAMADERKRMLRSIRPLMKELSHMSEVDIRFRVLQKLGVKLGSKPDRNCLPQLQAAAASADPAISRNALELIEQISGEYGCLGLDSLPPVFRERALHVYFQDQHLIPAAPGEGKPAP